MSPNLGGQVSAAEVGWNSFMWAGHWFSLTVQTTPTSKDNGCPFQSWNKSKPKQDSDIVATQPHGCWKTHPKPSFPSIPTHIDSHIEMLGVKSQFKPACFPPTSWKVSLFWPSGLSLRPPLCHSSLSLPFRQTHPNLFYSWYFLSLLPGRSSLSLI